MNLYEKYRPRTLADVLGQPKAVKVIRGLERRGIGGRAFWISGPSGVGKSTLARIIAAMVAHKHSIVEYDSADAFTQAECQELRQTMPTFGWPRDGFCAGQEFGGRAWIIDEAHGLRKPIIRQLLGILERLPAHCVVIFTTTREGQDSLFEDHIDAHPLLSRCIVLALTGQGLSQPFARRLVEIADAEGLNGGNGDAFKVALRLVKHHRNNLRHAIQDVEAGALATA